MTEFHDRPHDRFRAATDDLAPDVDTLVSGGLARGRERRRRRVVLTSVGAGAAVAAVAFGVLALPAAMQGAAPAPVAPAGGLTTGVDGATDPVPAPTVETSTTPSPGEAATGLPDETPSAPPTAATPSAPSPETSPETSSGGDATTAPPNPTTTVPADDRDLAVSAEQVPSTFTSLMGGQASDVEAYPEPGMAIAHFRWDGFFTSVILGPAPNGSPMEACRRNAGTGSCEAEADGAAYSTWQETGPEADGGVTGRGITWFTDDGWQVDVISYNAAEGKDSEVLAEEPPLSADELALVASSGVWFE